MNVLENNWVVGLYHTVQIFWSIFALEFDQEKAAVLSMKCKGLQMCLYMSGTNFFCYKFWNIFCIAVYCDIENTFCNFKGHIVRDLEKLGYWSGNVAMISGVHGLLVE